MICPYCNKLAKWCENNEIYGRNYGESFMVWLCKPCDAYVGCHCNTKEPLGTMANKETREWRIKAHKAFDQSWKHHNADTIKWELTGKDRRSLKHQKFKRRAAYERLRIALKLSAPIHIGESDIERCKEIINISA